MRKSLFWCSAVTCAAAMALIVTSRAIPEESPTQPAAGSEINRPTYNGYGKYEIEPCTGAYKIQGLEELASRWGLKPYEKLHAKHYPRTGRVIFRELRTGAVIWRVTDDPFSMERHRYAHESSWNCDASLFCYIAAGGESAILSGDMSRALELPSTRPREVYNSSLDPAKPTVHYFWRAKQGLMRGDFISGKAEVLYPCEKFEPMSHDFPGREREIVALRNCSPDGQWILGRAGGQQDKGKWFFAAKTDGTELRTAKVPEGMGVHSVLGLPSNNPMIQVGTSGIKGPIVYDFKTMQGKIVPNAGGHGDWRPGTLQKVHEAGGDGIHLSDIATGKDEIIFDVSWIEDFFAWQGDNPHWFFFNGQSAVGSDVVLVKSDGSRTGMRLCAVCPMYPQCPTYNSLAFAASSPDGTKMQYMSSMFGSVDEYLVVAKRPDPPVELAASLRSGNVALSWKAPAARKELLGYLVYRGEESGKEKTCLTDQTLKEPSFTLPPLADGKAQYYAVTSVEQCGQESNYSGEVCVGGDEPWPGDVRIYVEAESGEMTLPMRPALGAVVASNGYYAWQTKEGQPGTLRFSVSVPKQARYYFIGRVSGNAPAAPWTLRVDGQGQVPLSVPVAESAWQWIPWTAAGRPYTAVLTKGLHTIELSTSHDRAAVDLLLVATDPNWKPQQWGTCNERPPRAVSGLRTLETDVCDVTLGWDVSPEKHVHHYNIYSSRESSLTPTQKYLVASPAQPPYLDWGLKPNTPYRYLITAVDRQGNESAPSAPVVAKTAAQPPPAVTLEFPANAEQGDRGQGKDHVDLPCETARQDDFILWAELKQFERKGAPSEVFLDGKSLGTWRIEYDQTALRGGRMDKGDWVWAPLIVPRAKQHGPLLIRLAAGKHQLRIDGGIFHVGKVILTNDPSFKPQGKLNTLFGS